MKFSARLRQSITIKQSQRGGIMDIFRSVAAPSPAPAQPATSQTQQTQQTDVNGVVPKQESTTPASPLDAHKDVWNSPAQPADKAIFENLDPDKVREAISKADIVGKHLTQDLATKIAAGGAEAVQAVKTLLNSTVQDSLSSSTLTTTQIVEAALKKQQEQFMDKLPQLFKKFSAQEGLLAENPIFANPVVKPIAEALQESFQRKNPNANAKEIQSQVVDVLTALGTSLAPKPANTGTNTSNKQEEDWGKFFDATNS